MLPGPVAEPGSLSPFVLACIAVSCAALISSVASLLCFGASSARHPRRKDLRRLQAQYIAVYFFAVFGDWLQGAYFYAAYAAFGYSRSAINHLFVVGFGAAAVLGSWAGALADRFGRKTMAQVFFTLYIAGCGALHIGRSLPALVVGRLLCGTATTLLFSTFTAWVVAAHNERGLPAPWLADTFRLAQTVNFAVAIASGLVAEAVTDAAGSMKRISVSSFVYVGGDLAPFELAAAVLLVGLIVVSCVWEENSLERRVAARTTSHLTAGMRAIVGNVRLQACCCFTSCFESCMYVFVMLWTPALKENATGGDLPLGVIFASFMASAMLGAQAFGLSQYCRVDPCVALIGAFVVAALALGTPFLFQDAFPRFLAFLVFELSVGLYFPAASTVKAALVPEKTRGAVYAAFRVPLNALVIATLLAPSMSILATLVVCIALLVLAALAASAVLFCDDGKSSARRRQEEVGEEREAASRRTLLNVSLLGSRQEEGDTMFDAS